MTSAVFRRKVPEIPWSALAFSYSNVSLRQLRATALYTASLCRLLQKRH